MTHIVSLGSRDFEEIFQTMTGRIARKIREANLQFTKPSPEERDEFIRCIVRDLLDSRFEAVGEHRRTRWEEGWGANLEALKGGQEDAILPRYFNNNIAARWKQEFIKPTEPGFDQRGLAVILEWLFEEYMKDASAVYEFGCGTGRHLLQLRDVNPSAELCGLDWAESSQGIIAELVRQGRIDNVTGRKFDFFQPDHSLSLGSDSVVYTVGALEQVGNRHGAFIEYLLEKRPKLCVHVEPVKELLDPNHLLDFLAIEYFTARKYLSGFLGSLQACERDGQLKIHKAQRTFFGGNMYVDHYSVVVWSPL